MDPGSAPGMTESDVGMRRKALRFSALFATTQAPLKRDTDRAVITAHHVRVNVGRFHGAAQLR